MKYALNILVAIHVFQDLTIGVGDKWTAGERALFNVSFYAFAAVISHLLSMKCKQDIVGTIWYSVVSFFFIWACIAQVIDIFIPLKEGSFAYLLIVPAVSAIFIKWKYYNS